MELFGTLIICYIGGMVKIANERKEADMLQLALTNGFALGIMVYAGAHISGSHYNPAITLALVLIKKCEKCDAFVYILFQTIGGTLGGILVCFMGNNGVSLLSFTIY